MTIRIAIPIIMAASILIGTNPSLAQDHSSLAKEARQVLVDYCYRCHGEQGAVEGGFNFLLDRDHLVSRRKIVPGDSRRSRLFERMESKEMPPPEEKERPSDAAIATVRKWIDAGAPNFSGNWKRFSIDPNQVVERMVRDLKEQPEETRPFLRYFTLAPLANAGFLDDNLETYRQALSKLVNSLSWSNRIVAPQAIDESRTLYRIDLRDYKWTPKTWEEVASLYPYGVVSGSEAERHSQLATETRMPIVRADWFVAAASAPPLYHQILQLPDSEAELEKQLRVDVEDDIRTHRSPRAAFNGSGVSRHNRMIERHETFFGAYWKSYDFSGSAANQNVLASPLGPASFKNRFQHVGSEIIFNLPNGMQAYFLSDASGRRIDKGPLEVVSDPRRPDRAVVNGLSCMSCHARGIIPKDDQVRPLVEQNPSAFSATDRSEILALYVPAKKMQALMSSDAERFKKAVAAAGHSRDSVTEPVATLAARFESELNLPLAAAELGLPTAKLTAEIKKSPQLGKTLGPLLLPGGVVPRDTFTFAYPNIVHELQLGRVLPVSRPRSWGHLPPWLIPPSAPATVAPRAAVEATKQHDHLKYKIALNENRLDSSPKERLLAIGLVGRISLMNPDDGGIYEEIPLGSRGNVGAIAFSPDGEHLAIGFSDNGDAKVKVYDLPTKEWIATFASFSGILTDVCFTPDGKKLVVGEGPYPHIFDLATRREGPALPRIPSAISALSMSRDGKTLIIAGEKLHFFDAVTGKEIDTRNEHVGGVLALAVSRDGRTLATGGMDKKIRLWDLATRKVRTTLSGHSGAITDVVFSHDSAGERLFSSSTDFDKVQFPKAEAKVWDVAKSKELIDLTGHTRGVARIRLTSDGRTPVTVGIDATLRVWDLNIAGDTKRLFAAHDQPIAGVAVSSDSRWVVTAASDRTIKLWDAETLAEIRSIPVQKQAGKLVLTDDKKHIWCIFVDNKLRKFDSTTGAELTAINLAATNTVLGGIAMTKDEKTLAVGNGDGGVLVVDVASGSVTRTLQGHLGIVHQVAFSPDGKNLAAAGGNRFVRIWDPFTGKNLQDLSDQRVPVTTLAFHPDNKRILATCQNSSTRTYDYYTAEVQGKFEPHPASLRVLAITPDGTRALSGSEIYGFVRGKKMPVEPIVLWDVASGKKLRTWQNFEGAVRLLAMAPNGEFAIAVSGHRFRRIDLSPPKKSAQERNSGAP